MPASRTQSADMIQCRHFTFRLFQRQGVYYADGRSAVTNLGKHSLATRDRAEALQRLNHLDLKLAVDAGLCDEPTPLAGEPLPLEAGWRLFLESCERPAIMGGVSAKTAQRYRAVRDKHSAFSRDRAVSDWHGVDRAHVEAYGRRLHSDGYADRTIYLELNLLIQVVKWLVTEGRLPASSRIRLDLEKVTGSETVCYTKQQVDAMLAHCHARADLHWLGSLIAVLAGTGMRISEAAQLRWSDVDLEQGKLRIEDERFSARRRQAGVARTTKGKRSRVVPLHSTIVQLLGSLARASDGLVFHGPRGGRLKPDVVRNVLVHEVITPLAARFPAPAGEPGFADARLHSFRHYFVSQCFAHGASEGEVKEWVGHRDSEMVARYRHLFDDVSRQRIERIGFFQPLVAAAADGPRGDAQTPTTREAFPAPLAPADAPLPPRDLSQSLSQ